MLDFGGTKASSAMLRNCQNLYDGRWMMYTSVQVANKHATAMEYAPTLGKLAFVIQATLDLLAAILQVPTPLFSKRVLKTMVKTNSLVQCTKIILN